MKKQSAGILLFRRQNNSVEVLLVHPGGPFRSGRDAGAWSVPKGEFAENEGPLDAAKREFTEETGILIEGNIIPLGVAEQSSRKKVHAWAVEGDLDASLVTSNMFSIEWPPQSGKVQEFPEIDKAEWFSEKEARQKIHKGQEAFIDRLLYELGIELPDSEEK